jgi:hypothetical protein
VSKQSVVVLVSFQVSLEGGHGLVSNSIPGRSEKVYSAVATHVITTKKTRCEVLSVWD